MSSKSEDSIGIIIGNIGKWQIQRIIANLLISLPGIAQIFVGAVFSMQIPDFRCMDNSSSSYSKNCSKECTKYEYDTSFWTETVPMKFDMICGSDYLILMTKMTLFIGFAIGTFSAGLIADKFGRKTSILIMSHLFFASGLVLTIVNSYIFFLFVLLSMAISAIGIYTSAIVWNLECVSGKWKMIVGMMMALIWPFGRLLSVALAWNIREWRLMIQILSGVHFVTPIIMYWVPESPRWLLASSKESNKKKAEEILRKVVKINKGNMELFEQNIQNQIESSRRKDTSYHPYYKVFKSKTLRNRSFILFINWFTNSLVLYGLNLNWKSLTGNLFTNFSIAAALDIVARILSIFILHQFSYKKVYTLSMFMVALSFLLTFGFSLGDYENNYPVVILSMFGTFFISMTFSIIWIYTTEIFPTNYRNGALGASSFVARIGGILATTMGPLSKVNENIPKAIFSVTTLTSAGLALLLPETGDSLPDAIEDCE
ncbi:organic cation transporter protein [Lepeophtheirus salmonis]|uniref:organic cation transporter protein n=1 Tax=Lepeophtheirus salmonis TaxID=72036 RepID=UPI001AEB1E1D|nr:organic cation transporter protein-like isoform X1 [Lepeophtheirus salmonis]XP_040570966.1 organic cation transporter protein-like isoform X1 [Lepeophtheirus salmonis]